MRRNRRIKKQAELVERMMVLVTNLSVSFYGWFPDVLQSETLAVVDQRDGFDVLPQLRGDENASPEGRQRRKEREREQEVHPNLLRLPPTLPPEHLRVSDLRLHEVLLAR